MTGLLPPTGSTSFSWIARSNLTWTESGNSPTSSSSKVPSSSLHELAEVALGGTREGAFLVSEQDRFARRFFGNAPQFTATKGLARALTGAVDGARDQFLADA